MNPYDLIDMEMTYVVSLDCVSCGRGGTRNYTRPPGVKWREWGCNVCRRKTLAHFPISEIGPNCYNNVKGANGIHVRIRRVK